MIRPIFGILFLALMLAGPLNYGARSIFVGSPFAATMSVLCLVAAVLCSAVYLVIGAAKARSMAALTEEDRCPICGFALNGLTPGDDGCTVCPECGAAWRRDE